MSPKTVLITGCSEGGIGGALAESFQKRGFHVFATARSLAKMKHLAELPNVTLLTLDVTSRESIEGAVAAVTKHTNGTLDVLVNNSGLGYSVPALDANLKMARDVFDVNFFGVVETTQLFAPLLIASKGTIVNICSTAAHVDGLWSTMYAASKAAQEKFSESLRLELEPFEIKVLSIIAGAVATNMAANVPHFEVREGLFYKASEKEIARQAAGEMSHGGMDISLFADKVVGDVVRGATGRVFRGKMATFVWVLTSFFPQFLQDKFIKTAQGSSFQKA
ncbi:NAD(P)-binding protein [Thozetella sp. PMI_491]|nr:NAD(P)-binding protein [Thozetella sp. PMI_491]